MGWFRCWCAGRRAGSGRSLWWRCRPGGQVARVGRLPLVDALAVSGPPPTAEAASAVRARDLLARTSVREGVRFDGPVLLVDDTVRTRWTVTVASALLAEAGASQVMPLAVHLLP